MLAEKCLQVSNSFIVQYQKTGYYFCCEFTSFIGADMKKVRSCDLSMAAWQY